MNNNNIFNCEWERFLDTQMLDYNRCCQKAYICSPLGAESKDVILENMHCARAYMLYADARLNVVSRAPHAYLPLLISEKTPAERALALEFGIKLLEQSEILLVCGMRISAGMRNEIARAAALRMEIVTFDDDMFTEVKKIVTKNGGNKTLVTLNRDHPLLASLNPIYYKGGDELWSDFLKSLGCAHNKK
ncbi:MAG: hypothetical protein IJF32_09205 [Oscillospiraceae bacterium]|nr:hypothetical protein [Oscillospiraceae bacterium]